MEERPLANHPISIGNTRPAIAPLVHVPWQDCIVWGTLAMEAAVFRIQFLIPLAIGFAFACTLYRKDYHAGRCFVCWIQTSAFDFSARSLGGTAIIPTPGKGAYRGIARG